MDECLRTGISVFGAPADIFILLNRQKEMT